MNRFAKSVARTLLHQGGWLRGVRYWNRNGFRILMYHDFPSVPGIQEALAKQCLHINQYYQVVTMTDISGYLREGKRLPPNALAVTVDDGNRDFLVNAYPVFKAHRIPVIVFLVSGFLDRKLWLWWDKIIYMLEQSRRASFQLSLSAAQAPATFAIETPEQRQQAISTITLAMKELPDTERNEILRNLLQLLDVELPRDPPSHLASMEWSEVREMAAHGIDFGAHTVTHPVLSRIQDPQELFHEIEHSKRRIEEELGRPVPHFCYPYGCLEDFNDATLQVLNECKFQTAVTAIHGLNSRHTHPLKLKRLSADAMLPELYFQERLAGLHSG